MKIDRHQNSKIRSVRKLFIPSYSRQTCFVPLLHSRFAHASENASLGKNMLRSLDAGIEKKQSPGTWLRCYGHYSISNKPSRLLAPAYKPPHPLSSKVRYIGKLGFDGPQAVLRNVSIRISREK
ncbi:unnamed protein product [Ectocarpus sp. 12 AP-2014]